MALKILHCVPTFDVGGLGSFALELIRAWKAQFPEDQHVVQAALFPTTKPLLRGAFHALLSPTNCVEVQRRLTNPEAYWNAVRTALSQHGRNGWDGAIVYNVFDLPWVCRGVRGAGFRGTFRVHVGTHIAQNERDMGPVISEVPGPRRFIFPCESVMRTTLAIPGFDPRTAGPIIYNGVDPSRFKRGDRAGVKVLRFGFTGRMVDNAKDWRTLIEAFVGLADLGVSLVLAGDGVHRKDYETLALRKRAPVTFVGALDAARIPNFLGSLDVFIMAALPIEGFSMSLIEAMATGLPIIATNVPSNVEALGDAALYTRPGDVEGYRALIMAMTDSELRDTFAALSAERAKQFTIAATAARYREELLHG